MATDKANAAASCEEKTKLVPADRAPGDRFGVAVALNGDYAVIGANFDDDNGDNAGSAYIFNFNGSTWVEQDKLLASDGEFFDSFGVSVAISGDYAVVGASGPSSSPDRSGAAYVFHREGTSWVEQAQLVRSVPKVGVGAGAAGPSEPMSSPA